MGRLRTTTLRNSAVKGFIIVPDFIRGDILARLQATQRRVLPTWEEVQDKPPQDQAGNSLLVCFPHEASGSTCKMSSRTKPLCGSSPSGMAGT